VLCVLQRWDINKHMSFNQYLVESKQVGVIYHFTNLESLIYILFENVIASSRQEYISFTRNYNLKNTYNKEKPWSGVRIAVDGDMLTDRYKLSPYSDTVNGIKGEESEERILDNKIVGVIKLIKQIDILINNDFSKLDIKIDIENPSSSYGTKVANLNDYMQKLEEMLEYHRINISMNKIKIVDSYRPVR